MLCRAPAAPCLQARPCRNSSCLADHRRLLHPFCSTRAAMDPRGRQCRPGRSHSCLLPHPAHQRRRRGQPSEQVLQGARLPRGPGPEHAAQKPERTRPVEVAANLVQNHTLEDHVYHGIWDCVWDCERLAKLLSGFGNLETRRGRRRSARHRTRNSASHAGVLACASALPVCWRAPAPTSAPLPPSARTVVSARNCVGRVLPSGPANRTMHSTTRDMCRCLAEKVQYGAEC